MTFALNHLAPFLLTSLVLDRLRSSAPARVVVVASQVEARGAIHFEDLQLERGYQPLVAYDQSKLANVLFTYELARRLAGTQVTANCLHPGVIATNLLADYMGKSRLLGGKLNALTYPGPKKGAETSIRLASDPELEGVSGKYFKPEGLAESSRSSHDPELARRLWEVSERLTGRNEILA
jgi:NAD(P)-dependent dehydrogenase (short-subunit alcohol dehydrogenase family)